MFIIVKKKLFIMIRVCTLFNTKRVGLKPWLCGLPKTLECPQASFSPIPPMKSKCLCYEWLSPAPGLLFDFGSISPGSILGLSPTTYCDLKLYITALRVSNSNSDSNFEKFEKIQGLGLSKGNEYKYYLYLNIKNTFFSFKSARFKSGRKVYFSLDLNQTEYERTK